MLKKRIIACLVVKDGIVAQSKHFQKYLPVGKPEIAVEFLNHWGIDEIVLLDIDATREKRGPNVALIRKVSDKCFVPLSVGGGIHTLDEMREVIRNGAEKVVINAAAVSNPELIKEAAKVLGSQCVVVSIDVRKKDHGGYEVFTHSGKIATGLDPADLAKKVQSLGAGEIFLNSIDNDGAKGGYDLTLIKEVSAAVSIPVIVCGGAGHPQHFLEGFKEANIAGAAAGNYFHFTEHSPIVTKDFLRQHQVNVRLESYAKYEQFNFDPQGRIDKAPDSYLQKIKFEYHEEEVI